MVVVIVVVVIGAVRGSGGVMCIHGRVEPQPLCVCEYVLYGTHFVRTTRKHHAPDEAAPYSPCPGVIPFIHAARARQALAVRGGHVLGAALPPRWVWFWCPVAEEGGAADGVGGMDDGMGMDDDATVAASCVSPAPAPATHNTSKNGTTATAPVAVAESFPLSVSVAESWV
ncbi:hypothetical protein PCL_00125 [Purpureocillium lilacinum]|uniref:Secreted protein n=1 Tax=Purpureocillium lilacinum TaxID=33203 RepID=A0A2U3E635_PURLI|nr:hypothetical protein PCL_00125 [Purpureocillium lilacinum]